MKIPKSVRIDETAQNFDTRLRVYPLADCFQDKGAAEAAKDEETKHNG